MRAVRSSCFARRRNRPLRVLARPATRCEWAAALFSLFAMGAGCTESPSAPTQVVVLVGGDSRIRRLDVRIYDAVGEEVSSALTIDLTRRDPARLPTSFSVVPPASRAADRFRMIVQGVEETAEHVTRERARREVIVAFSSGATTLLPIVLSAACSEERCGCSGDGPCARTCVPDPSAAANATCTSVPIYESLPPVLPGAELDALRAGIDGCSRGTVPAASGDCEDLDECAFYVDDCQVEPRACVNLTPDAERYACACPSGYSGSGEADDPCKVESKP